MQMGGWSHENSNVKKIFLMEIPGNVSKIINAKIRESFHQSN